MRMLGDIINNSALMLVLSSLLLIASAVAYAYTPKNEWLMKMLALSGIFSCSFIIGVVAAAESRIHLGLLFLFIMSLAFTVLFPLAIIPIARKVFVKLISSIKEMKKKRGSSGKSQD